MKEKSIIAMSTEPKLDRPNRILKFEAMAPVSFYKSSHFYVFLTPPQGRKWEASKIPSRFSIKYDHLISELITECSMSTVRNFTKFRTEFDTIRV